MGIDFEGAGSNIEILNNHIHNIVQTLSSCNAANALAVALYGTQAPASINNVTLWGNEIDHNTTGCSENVSFDGNVQYFVQAKNLVHDGDNIGLDNIGFEGVSTNSAYDQARDGWVFQNTVYNISSTTNPVYHNQVGADAYYCDGCTRIIVERNLIHDSDLSEMASEHSGHTSSYVMFRNNIIYHSLYVGLSIGGYAKNVGGTDHCVIVNNSLWDDGTYGSSGLGEFQIQYHATNNTVANNIFDGYTEASEDSVPPDTLVASPRCCQLGTYLSALAASQGSQPGCACWIPPASRADEASAPPQAYDEQAGSFDLDLTRTVLTQDRHCTPGLG